MPYSIVTLEILWDGTIPMRCRILRTCPRVLKSPRVSLSIVVYPLLHRQPWKFLLKVIEEMLESVSSIRPERFSRLYIPGSWQMPQGGTDEGENPRNAAIRELREETGVISAEILAEVPYWLTYDFPPNVKAKINRRWGSDWKGQAQKWFLFKFTGKEEEINLLGDGTEKPEFGKWAWMSPEQVFQHAVDFKKPVYEQVLKVFGPYLELDRDKGICSGRNGTQ